MIEVADIFRRFAEGYLLAHGAGVLPSHRRAIVSGALPHGALLERYADIVACRTQALGGQLWRCGQCGAEVYSYHSCRNRGCPKCHTHQAERWLQARQAEVLPCRYFHITVTVPQELRETLRSQQKTLYPLLMKAAAEAIIELARDPRLLSGALPHDALLERYVGGTPGVLAVLHTWTQQLLYHPHVHCLVTGGGISNGDWHPARRDFLLPYAALARLVRGKLMAALAKRCPGLALPKAVWEKPWVVHCTPWGEGAEAVLRYLARYVFRTAISNSRIESLDADSVTFRHKHRASNRWRRTRLSGHEFMRRFLQHVLPQGLHKVRYYGLWHPSKREEAAKVRLLLQVRSSSAPLIAQSMATAGHPSQTAGASDAGPQDTGTPPVRPCPCCGQGRLLCVRRLYPKQPEGP